MTVGKRGFTAELRVRLPRRRRAAERTELSFTSVTTAGSVWLRRATPASLSLGEHHRFRRGS